MQGLVVFILVLGFKGFNTFGRQQSGWISGHYHIYAVLTMSGT